MPYNGISSSVSIFHCIYTRLSNDENAMPCLDSKVHSSVTPRDSRPPLSFSSFEALSGEITDCRQPRRSYNLRMINQIEIVVKWTELSGRRTNNKRCGDMHSGHSEWSWTFEEFLCFSVKHLTDSMLLPNSFRSAILLVECRSRTERSTCGNTKRWLELLIRCEEWNWRQHPSLTSTICGSQFGKSESPLKFHVKFSHSSQVPFSTFQYYLSQPS
jgi:hypothetical protein